MGKAKWVALISAIALGLEGTLYIQLQINHNNLIDPNEELKREFAGLEILYLELNSSYHLLSEE